MLTIRRSTPRAPTATVSIPVLSPLIVNCLYEFVDEDEMRECDDR